MLFKCQTRTSAQCTCTPADLHASHYAATKERQVCSSNNIFHLISTAKLATKSSFKGHIFIISYEEPSVDRYPWTDWLWTPQQLILLCWQSRDLGRLPRDDYHHVADFKKLSTTKNTHKQQTCFQKFGISLQRPVTSLTPV